MCARSPLPHRPTFSLNRTFARTVCSRGTDCQDCGPRCSPPPPPPPPFRTPPPLLPPLPPRAPPPPALPGRLFTFDAANDLAGWMTTSGTSNPYNWIRWSGRVPSSGTGPTTGFGGRGSYFYCETSAPRVPNDQFLLIYDGSACTAVGFPLIGTITFRYHMLGVTMGSLYVIPVRLGAQQAVSSQQAVWSRIGDQGDVWLEGQAQIMAEQVYFIGVRGVSWTSDIALDHVDVRCANFPPPSPALFQF